MTDSDSKSTRPRYVRAFVPASWDLLDREDIESDATLGFLRVVKQMQMRGAAFGDDITFRISTLCAFFRCGNRRRVLGHLWVLVRAEFVEEFRVEHGDEFVTIRTPKSLAERTKLSTKSILHPSNKRREVRGKREDEERNTAGAPARTRKASRDRATARPPGYDAAWQFLNGIRDAQRSRGVEATKFGVGTARRIAPWFRDQPDPGVWTQRAAALATTCADRGISPFQILTGPDALVHLESLDNGPWGARDAHSGVTVVLPPDRVAGTR